MYKKFLCSMAYLYLELELHSMYEHKVIHYETRALGKAKGYSLLWLLMKLLYFEEADHWVRVLLFVNLQC